MSTDYHAKYYAHALACAAGHNVRSAVVEGLAGYDDPRVLHAAAAEGRVLTTFDTDFADIRRYPPGTHAGIVVFRLRDQRWRALQQPVPRLLAGNMLARLDRGLAIVAEARVRLRRSTTSRALGKQRRASGS